MKKSKPLASALNTSATDAKVMPTKPSTGSASSIVGARLMPSAKTTAMMAAAEINALNAAHSISAKTMSSSAIGAFMMLSQVRCTCMRE